MSNTKFPVLYYLFGGLCAFLLGSSLCRDLSAIVGKAVFALARLITVVYRRRLELGAHVRHVEYWPSLRYRRRWHVLIAKYVLWRGDIFTVVFIGPTWVILGLSIKHYGYLAMMILLLAIITIYLGHEKWNNCQRQYAAWSFRQRAEVERDATSLTN